MRLLACLLCCPACWSTTLLKVAAGGPGGAGWVPDAPYVLGGSTQAVAGAQSLPYNWLRYAPPGSSIRYTFNLPGSVTSITLFFIEPRFNQTAGQRLFTISINGAPVSTNLDLFVSAGALTPTTYTFPVAASAGSPLTIAFLSTQGNAVVSGIQLDGNLPPPPVSGLSLQCPSGTVGFSALTAPAGSQDVVIVPGVADTYRFHHVYLREVVQFTGSLEVLTVSIRAGSIDLTPPLALKVAGGLNAWQDRPAWPVGLPSYDVALRFTGSAALAGNLTGGGLYWEVCGFEVAPTAQSAELCVCPSGTPCGWFICTVPQISADCLPPRGSWNPGLKEGCIAFVPAGN